MEFRVITVYTSVAFYYVTLYINGIHSNDVRGMFELIGQMDWQVYGWRWSLWERWEPRPPAAKALLIGGPLRHG